MSSSHSESRQNKPMAGLGRGKKEGGGEGMKEEERKEKKNNQQGSQKLLGNFPVEGNLLEASPERTEPAQCPLRQGRSQIGQIWVTAPALRTCLLNPPSHCLLFPSSAPLCTSSALFYLLPHTPNRPTNYFPPPPPLPVSDGRRSVGVSVPCSNATLLLRGNSTQPGTYEAGWRG